MAEERTTDGRRIVYAPRAAYPANNTTRMIVSVALADDEDVEWHWSHSEAGSVVTGYTVRSKPNLCDKKFRDEILETLVSHLRNLRFLFP